MQSAIHDVCVVGGLGHVGLPLGFSLANAGKKVVLFDMNEKARNIVFQGKIPLIEAGAEELLTEVLGKNLFDSSEKKVNPESYFVIIVVGTPVGDHVNPKFTIFKNFFDEIMDMIGNDQHVILRNTVFPGTTEKIKAHIESKGKLTRVSYCPERIAQG